MLNYNYNIINTFIRTGTAGNAAVPFAFYKVSNDTIISQTIPINGYTSSFFIDDTNENKVTINDVVSTQTGIFAYELNDTILTTLLANVNNATGSTTMSIIVPKAGINITSQFFNPTTTQAKLTSSFNPIDILGYSVTASVIFNKGNISNSNINYRVSGSADSTSAFFKIRKNATETLVNDITASGLTTGNTTNNYAFSITASLSGSINWANSSSFRQVTMSLELPEISQSLVAYTTASILTASFAATTGINPYNITASVITLPFEPYYVEEYIMVAGGASGQNGGRNQANLSGGGGGAGAVVSGSQMLILPNTIYTVNIGLGGIASEASGSTNGTNSEFLISGSGNYVLRAPGGGITSDGGSGGGVSGGPSQGQQNPGFLSLPATGSGNFLTNITGSKGGNGCSVAVTGIPAQLFSISGGGGGAAGPGQNASCGSACSTGGSGGPGVYNAMVEYTLGVSGSLAAGGDGGLPPGGCSDAVGGNGTDALFYGGGGQGGHGDGNSNNFYRGGYGKDGVFVFKYLGAQKGRGGTVTFDGTYTYHTFTASGQFYSTANLLPEY